jgi:hypothetical protein
MPGVQTIRVGYEHYGAQADIDFFTAEMLLPKNTRFTIALLEWPREGPGSKNDRVQRLGPDFRNHRFYLPFDTNTKSYTTAQKRMLDSGYAHRIAKPIIQVDEDRQRYDLSVQFREQVEYFPNTTFKDLVDAASRIYDLNPIPPGLGEESYYEPEFV